MGPKIRIRSFRYNGNRRQEILLTAQELERPQAVPRKAVWASARGSDTWSRPRIPTHLETVPEPQELPTSGQDQIAGLLSFQSGSSMQSGRIPRGPVPTLASATAIFSAVVILGLAVTPTVGGDHPWGRFFHKHFHHGEIPPGQIATMNGGYWL